MTDKNGEEIERKWLLDNSDMETLCKVIRAWDCHYITQWYLTDGALGAYLELLRGIPARSLLWVEQDPEPWTKPIPHWAYLVGVGSSPGAVRLRRKKDSRSSDIRYFLTIKGKGSVVRPEFEIELPEEIFAILLDLQTQGGVVIKQRFTYPYNDRFLELDIFQEAHEGLVLLEVEFKTKEEAEAYILPSFIERFNPRDVSEEERYGNLSLAVNGLPDGA